MQLKDIKTIKILGEHFKLIFTKDAVAHGSSLRYGTANFDDNEITIWDSPHREGTIIHEILEVIKNRAESNLKHDDLTRIAHLILAVIKDNPELFELIIKGGNANVEKGEKDAS